MSAFHERLACEHDAEAAPFVLGALSPTEAASYADHLAVCPSCRAEVALLQETVDALSQSAPPAQASPEIIGRVMSIVRKEAEILASAGPQADRPTRRARPRRWRLALGGLAAACAAAAVIAAATLVSGSAPGRVIAASVSATGARADLRETGTHGELVISGMPQPPLGKVYEVWRARARDAPEPTDALFAVSRTGSAAVDVPGSLRGIQKVMVTAEPRGGSSRPTSAPVIVATLGTR